MSRLFLDALRVLVERVVVVRKILQVALQVLEHLGRILCLKMLPVPGVQPVAGCKGLLRIHDELWKLARLIDLDDPHTEVRRNLVNWIEIDKGFVDLRGIVVAKLFEIELVKMAIDPILVVPRAVLGEEASKGFSAAQLGETEADHTIGICDSLRVGLVFCLVEVVPNRNFVVEECDVVIHCLIEKHLFVEGPTEFVEGELVVAGARTVGDDRAVGLLRVEHLLSCEEVLAAPELELVEMPRLRVLGNEQGRDFDRLVQFSEFLVGAGLLIEDLIVVRIVRIRCEDLVVELDCLEWARGFVHGFNGKLEIDGFIRERIDALARNPFFEVSLGFSVDFRGCGRSAFCVGNSIRAIGFRK